MELAEKNNFDLVIVNDDLDRATQELENYIKNKIQ
jgi:guanylate kinase